MLNSSELFTADALRLDGRTIEQRLQDFCDYVSLIPFTSNRPQPADDAGSASSWRDLFFPRGSDDVQHLAGLYRRGAGNDGQLPPQQAFLLAFLHQLETPRALLNQLPPLHRQLYYRDLLGLQQRAAQADQVVLSFQLSQTVIEQLLAAGTVLDAGQDSQGRARQYLLDQALQANHGKLEQLRWLRRDGTRQLACVVQSDAHPELPPQGVRLFGAQAREQSVRTGRVVASDLLALAGGVRTITVTFASAPALGALSVTFSSDSGWLQPVTVNATGSTTTLVCTVGADQPAITAANGLDGFVDEQPLLKVTREDGHPLPAITQLAANITATQSSRVVFRAANGAGNWQQPLMPFGIDAQQGAALQLIAADWLRKRDAITLILTPEWDGLPAKSFSQWYQNYPSVARITNNQVFQVAIQALTARGWETLGNPQALFGGTTAPSGNPLSMNFTDLPGQASTSSDPADWTSRLRLTLSGQDFLHQEYWQQLEQGLGVDAQGQARLNPPYTPQWNSLAISFASTQGIALKQQYVLTPFGHHATTAPEEELAEPQLYLGFSGMQAGQKLSLYWKLNSPQPLALNWQYLNTENQWQSLNAAVLDHTGGWFDSGLWSATLPDNASDRAPWMPPGHHWLRATASVPAAVAGAAAAASADGISNYPLLQGLCANAMTATLADAQNIAADHFDQPLAVGTIVQSVANVAGLDDVVQVWPSEGGRAMETVDEFNLRVARQLSSRGRALRREDIRSLLLERFAEIFAVLMPDDNSDPGEQHITIIAAPGHADNTDRQRPALNRARLERMREYLQQRTSPWVQLHLANPEYRHVDVRYTVEFDAAVTPEFGMAQLNRALDRHYLPWAGDQHTPINSGNQLDYYQLLAYIQQQPQVTRVHELTIDGHQTSVLAASNQTLVPQWTGAVPANRAGVPVRQK